MKKHIVGVLVAGIFVTGGAFAAMPSRPNLSEVLNKRPSLSNIKKVINSIPMPIKDSSMT